MTERFTEWLLLLGYRDWALTQFTALGFAAVLCWEGIRLWPDPYRRWLRAAFLIGGGIIFYALILA
jgi:hypothetical protein